MARRRRAMEKVVVIGPDSSPEDIRAAARSLAAHFVDVADKHHGSGAYAEAFPEEGFLPGLGDEFDGGR